MHFFYYLVFIYLLIIIITIIIIIIIAMKTDLQSQPRAFPILPTQTTPVSTLVMMTNDHSDD